MKTKNHGRTFTLDLSLCVPVCLSDCAERETATSCTRNLEKSKALFGFGWIVCVFFCWIAFVCSLFFNIC